MDDAARLAEAQEQLDLLAWLLREEEQEVHGDTPTERSQWASIRKLRRGLGLALTRIEDLEERVTALEPKVATVGEVHFGRKIKR